MPPPAGAERARLFVALELPDAVRAELEHWRTGPVRSEPALRAVAAEALHVTLCFLGSHPVREINGIGDALTCVSGQPRSPLSLGAGVWLPPRRPRVLAVSLADPSGGLAGVQGKLATALSAGGWYTPQTRPFLAHVTLARVRERARLRSLELAEVQALRFEAERVTLFRSRLERGGARYEPLHTLELGARG